MAPVDPECDENDFEKLQQQNPARTTKPNSLYSR